MTTVLLHSGAAAPRLDRRGPRYVLCAEETAG